MPESVAQVTNKPLFSVSVADIGLEPSLVDRRLSRLFNLATLWKAVLLLYDSTLSIKVSADP